MIAATVATVWLSALVLIVRWFYRASPRRDDDRKPPVPDDGGYGHYWECK
jgi:hypothetical protein